MATERVLACAMSIEAEFACNQWKVVFFSNTVVYSKRTFTGTGFAIHNGTVYDNSNIVRVGPCTSNTDIALFDTIGTNFDASA